MARIEGQGEGGVGKGVNMLKELDTSACYLATPVLVSKGTSHICALLPMEGGHYIFDPAPNHDGSISIEPITVCSPLLFCLLRSFFGSQCQAESLASRGLTKMTDPSWTSKDSTCSGSKKINGCVAVKLEACKKTALDKVAVLMC